MSPAPQPLPLETLLDDAGWVRRLAARLVADPGTADDVAQETLLAAWTRPPARGTPARPWLARVLRNFVRQRARAEEARAARERSSSRGPSAPDDLLERAELAQKLARLVLELEEPYRRTVLRRFFDGWSAEEIARAEGTNPSTVRTRLERALAKLRERLERERGQEWLAALMPLVKMGGGLVMGTGAKIGIGLCTAALCGWLLWPRAEPLAPALEPPKEEVAHASAPLEGSAPVEREAQPVAPAAKESVASTAPVAVAAPPLAPGTIEGLVVLLSGEDERPIEGASVELWPEGMDPVAAPAPDEPPQASARSASDGSFRFSGLAPGGYTLQARSGQGPLHETRALLVEQHAGKRVKIAFGNTRIHGRAYDEEGQPLAGIPIRLDGGHEFKFELRARATTDANGKYEFEGLPGGKYFGLVTEDWQVQWPGRMWYLTLAENDELELDLGTARALAHWRGRVLGASGESVRSGGTLHLEHNERTKRGSEAKTYREVLFDESASFDLRLEPGNWGPGVSLRSKPDTRRGFDRVAITERDLEHDLVLSGARVHGTILDAATQKPLVGYTGTLQVGVRRASQGSPGTLQSVELDEGGKFAIDMLDEGDWELVTFPLVVAAPGRKFSFVIGPGETVKQLDVQVQAP